MKLVRDFKSGNQIIISDIKESLYGDMLDILISKENATQEILNSIIATKKMGICYDTYLRDNNIPYNKFSEMFITENELNKYYSNCVVYEFEKDCFTNVYDYCKNTQRSLFHRYNDIDGSVIQKSLYTDNVEDVVPLTISDVRDILGEEFDISEDNLYFKNNNNDCIICSKPLMFGMPIAVKNIISF